MNTTRKEFGDTTPQQLLAASAEIIAKLSHDLRGQETNLPHRMTTGEYADAVEKVTGRVVSNGLRSSLGKDANTCARLAKRPAVVEMRQIVKRCGLRQMVPVRLHAIESLRRAAELQGLLVLE